MHRILEKLDNAASTIVPLAYLAGMMIGTAAYFSGIVLDAGLAVGLALAIAVELHGFLEQRRVRAYWHAFTHAISEEVRDAVRPQLITHIIILGALVAFQGYNSWRFLEATTGHADPVRVLVLPLAFLVSGALSPLTHDASEMLRAASLSMQLYTVRKMAGQWKKRIRAAAGPAWWQFWRRRSEAIDLAPIAVALMLDAGDSDGARRIRMIADGLAAAEGANTQASPALASLAYPTAVLEAPQAPEMPDRPPTGPGTPQAATASRRRSGSTQNRPTMLKLETPPEWRKVAAQARAKGTNGRGVRTRVPVENYEPQARAAWDAGARSIPKMERATGMSHSAAQSWVRTLKAEAAAKASSAGQAAQ